MKGYLVGPRANLKNANLRSANLTNANFTATRLTGAFLTAATLTGVTSGRISGTPATLPTHWRLANGYLVGPRANLAGASLVNTDLTGADLTGANLKSAHLTGATLTGVTSGSITGPPASLPANWKLVLHGYLVGPGANLRSAKLTERRPHGRPLRRHQPQRRDPHRHDAHGRVVGRDRRDAGVVAGALATHERVPHRSGRRPERRRPEGRRPPRRFTSAAPT